MKFSDHLRLKALNDDWLTLQVLPGIASVAVGINGLKVLFLEVNIGLDRVPTVIVDTGLWLTRP